VIFQCPRQLPNASRLLNQWLIITIKSRKLRELPLHRLSPIFSVKDLLDLQLPRLSKRQHKAKHHFIQRCHRLQKKSNFSVASARLQEINNHQALLISRDDPNYGIRVHAHQNPYRTLIPKHMFEKIDSYHLKPLQDNAISNSGTDHMRRWLKIKSILVQIDVLTLLLKLRTRTITD
jgi:hypothetical protein